jgi:hypothetical protein
LAFDFSHHRDINQPTALKKERKKRFMGLVFTGAGATFDWMFFDNSKLI